MAVRSKAKARVRVFSRLRSLRDPPKSQLLPLVRHKETRLAAIEVDVVNFLMGLFVVLFIGLLASLFAWKPEWVFGQPDLSGFFDKAFQFVPIFLLGLIMPPLIVIGLAIGMGLRGRVVLLLLALAPAFTWTYLFYTDSRWHSWHAMAAIIKHPGLGALAIGATVFPASMIASVLIESLYEVYVSRRRRVAAGAQLTHLLIEAAAYMEQRNVRRWQESGFKSGLVFRLEAVALCLERDLVWEVKRRREDVVVWFRGTLAAKADAVRQLSRWVLTPKSDTREHLLEQLVTLLAAAARDDLDSFPMAAESRAERRRTIWLRFTATLSSLFSAALPGAIVWSAYKIGLLKDPWSGYSAIAAILWACVVLLGILDPSHGEHLESFTKLSGALHLPGFGSAKEKS